LVQKSEGWHEESNAPSVRSLVVDEERMRSGGNGARCGGIKVRTDTTKLSHMVTASFGDGRNLVRKGKMFIKDEAEVASRVEWC